MNNLVKISLIQRWLLFAAFATLAIGLVGTVVFAQKNDDTSDLRKSLGHYLNIYRINLKYKPKGYEEFDSFNLEKLSKQDIHNPGLNFNARTLVSGNVKLAGEIILPFKSAFLTKNKNSEYELLFFETQTVNGISFSFTGQFLKKRIENRPYIFTYLRGVLSKYKNGKRVSRKLLPFTIFANE